MMAAKKSTLPKEYQEVEFLQGTGTQYINTRITPDNQTTLSTIARCLSSDTDGLAWGSRVDLNNQAFILYIYKTGWARFLYGDRPFEYGQVTTTTTDWHEYSIYGSTGEMRIDGNVVVRPSQEWQFSGNSYPIYLLGANYASTPVGKYGQIKKCRVTKQGQTALFIPCYRKSDNKPGMYDLVTKTFFTNQGTGEFIVGADVN